MTAPGQALLGRLAEAASARGARLEAGEVRRRLATSGDLLERAVAFEEVVGGLVVGGLVLGLDTGRTHPPPGETGEGLDRELRHALVQVAFGGPSAATYWLDGRGWIHELSPLDRLRPHAADVTSFLETLLGAAAPVPHGATVALRPVLPEDADALFGSVPGCPVGEAVVRWPDEALEVLDERPWVERFLPPPVTILSAPRLSALLEGLAAFHQLEPALSVALLDGELERAPREPLVEVVATLPFTIPWKDGPVLATVGRTVSGGWTATLAPPRFP